MRKIIFLTIVLLAINILPAQNANGKLTAWSFTDELTNMINGYFKPTHQNIQIEYSMTPLDQFQRKLEPVLSSGRGAPDVFVLEDAFVRKYVESGYLLDLTDIYEANKNKLLAYPVEIGTYNGRVYALTWLASPGAMFYRRSMAKKYLDTDDPAKVQEYFSNPGKFLETAKLLKEKSGGKCVVTASHNELLTPFLGARNQPWVVNGKLVIDPIMEEFIDICKTLRNNKLEGGVRQWSEGWFVGMKDELRDEFGRPAEVFSYFLPPWGLHYVLKTNASGTSGDWVMIPGPVRYYWGGTWICAWKNTPNPNAAKEFIRYLTTDNGFLVNWAKDTGDFVINTEVVDKIKNNYSEPFLAGQNHYAAFAEIARNVNGKLKQKTDEAIEDLFMEEVDAYIEGEKTKEQALADFRLQVTKALGQNTSDKLSVWLFNNDLETKITNYFEPNHQEVQFQYKTIPMELEWFENRLDPLLDPFLSSYERGAPDVFTLESEFVRKYVASGLLLDLTDIYNANKNKLLAYPVEVGTYKGKVYALPWQAYPGAMFYRRSLAKKYLGTDDPAAVQAYFSDPDKFIETTKLLIEKSDGKCVVVSSIKDLENVFFSARKAPWVVNGRLVVDPVLEQYLDVCKILFDNMKGRISQWSEGWFDGMKDGLRDEYGRPVEVFSYFLPIWGLHYVLKTNTPQTAGDWAMIQGPVPYYWGGTWVCARKNTRNPNAARELIRYLTTDNDFIENWAEDIGDFVANTEVINKIKDNYSEPYLAGQNHYAAFAEIAKNVNGRLKQKTDQIIEAMLDKEVFYYIYGEKTKEQALADFKSQVQSELGF